MDSSNVYRFKTKKSTLTVLTNWGSKFCMLTNAHFLSILQKTSSRDEHQLLVVEEATEKEYIQRHVHFKVFSLTVN